MPALVPVPGVAPASARGGVWLIAVISAWLGGTALFGAVVAPALFALLPSRALAGLVVGRTLPALYLGGMAVGMLAVGLGVAAPPGSRARLARIGGGAAMALSCGAAQFVQSVSLRRVREAAGASLDALPPDDPLRAQFGLLHALSVGLLGVAALAALAVLVSSARLGRAPAPGDARK